MGGCVSMYSCLQGTGGEIRRQNGRQNQKPTKKGRLLFEENKSCIRKRRIVWRRHAAPTTLRAQNTSANHPNKRTKNQIKKIEFKSSKKKFRFRSRRLHVPPIGIAPSPCLRVVFSPLTLGRLFKTTFPIVDTNDRLPLVTAVLISALAPRIPVPKQKVLETTPTA